METKMNQPIVGKQRGSRNLKSINQSIVGQQSCSQSINSCGLSEAGYRKIPIFEPRPSGTLHQKANSKAAIFNIIRWAPLSHQLSKWATNFPNEPPIPQRSQQFPKWASLLTKFIGMKHPLHLWMFIQNRILELYTYYKYNRMYVPCIVGTYIGSIGWETRES